MFIAGMLIILAFTVWWLIDYHFRYGFRNLIHDVRLGKKVL
jgi:hypothetical protein